MTLAVQLRIPAAAAASAMRSAPSELTRVRPSASW